MPQECRGSDFVFTVPDDWLERSMVGFSAPPVPERPMTPNVLVAVNQMTVEEELGPFVNKQLDDLGRRAKDFELLLRRDARLDNVDCVEIVFHWAGGEQGIIKQRQIYARRPGNRVVSITHTAREDEFARCDAQFVEMLRTFAWAAP